MTTITHEQYQKDPVWHRLFMVIKANHQVQQYEIDELEKNRGVENFCIDSRHFRVIEAFPMIFIRYDTWTWLPKSLKDFARVSIREIVIYDDANEYMRAYQQGMNSTSKRDLHMPEN